MNLPTQIEANAPLPNGGILARLLDIFVIAVGALIATPVRTIPGQAGYDSALIAFALLFAFVVFPLFGMYRSARRNLFWRCVCVPAIIWLAVLCAALACVCLLHAPYLPAASWFAEWALLSGLGLIACRLLDSALSLKLADKTGNLRSVAIVGSGAHCRQLLRKVETSSDSLYQVAAIFDTAPGLAEMPENARAFRDRERFAAYLRRHGVDELWLALPLSEEKTIREFTRLFRQDLINIRFIPDVSGLALFDGEMVNLDGTSAINLVGSPLSSESIAQKDVFDRIFALLAVLAVSPVLIVVALAIKLTSRGPVLFKQLRKGANGRVFKIYKFRSMRVHTQTEGVLTQATRDDPRITRVGAFLRRTSLDELPQFFNVLRGEMSVVGPRPHAIEHDSLYQDIVDGYIHRYRVKPGITGWAQVNGFRGETDRIEKMQKRVECDLYYLSNWSLRLDLRIVVATIFKGLIHRNAY
ncbi:undecaprenyl-phosphate glucose phosphotransferase [Paraburkholderia bannensis]|uniref:undecaprenyl-phosphate glucose phosphotransferase n=1 Tax=Paraburkholderia bannensis TaxID=765414 RepID=UPI002AC367D6|nr:undecaprenyl-phosphate glucose phosphotransferase [Paraburkholderia bannensis]